MNEPTEISESVEMYLITIAMLQSEAEPVPLSLLAKELSHTPVSTNEMCRKLTEWGWATYQPYKGVTLTGDGRLLANQVLCRRRLWEVFLVDKLGLEPEQAEAFACHLEHATADDLARRLAAFLDYPCLSPQNEPIPCEYLDQQEEAAVTLDRLAVGQRGRVVRINDEVAMRDFLLAQGLVPGSLVQVLGVASDGSRLLEYGGRRLALTVSLAAGVHILLERTVRCARTPLDEAAFETVTGAARGSSNE